MQRQKRSMVARLRACFAVLSGVIATCAQAQVPDWPSRPVTILAPFAAGGTVDLVARIIAKKLTLETKEGFIVENRGGAGGTIAAAMLAHAKPDGLTLMVDHIGLAFSPSLYKHLSYDPTRDIIPLAYIGETPNVLVVTNELPVITAQQFIDLARAKPNSISFGSGGVGSAGHLAMALLEMDADIKLQHVPYKGSGPALTDLVSGQIKSMLLTMPAAMPFLKSGMLRAIATSGATRTPTLPNLPTLQEAGVKGFNYAPWYGFFAPTGTPAPLLDKMHDAINQALADPDVVKTLAAQGVQVHTMPRAQFAGVVQNDIATWAKTIHALGIQPQ